VKKAHGAAVGLDGLDAMQNPKTRGIAVGFHGQVW
jgi:hypothetical protein